MLMNAGQTFFTFILNQVEKQLLKRLEIIPSFEKTDKRGRVYSALMSSIY